LIAKQAPSVLVDHFSFFKVEGTMNCITSKSSPETVIIVLTERCDLDCFYCYEHEKNAQNMRFPVAMKIINAAFHRDPGRDLYLQYHGGEPLLAFKTMKRVCETVWQKDQPRPYLFFASTNGTKLHGEIKKWVEKNRRYIYFGLSLDGTPEMHNANRSNSYGKIDIAFFKEMWPEQPVKMTISRKSLPTLAEGVIHIHNLGFSVDSGFAQGVKWETEDYGHFAREMQHLADYYLDHPEVNPCSLFNLKLHSLRPFHHSEDFRWCGAGKEMSCFDMDGNGYPCHVFMPSVKEAAEANHERRLKAQELLKDSAQEIIDPKCKQCVISSSCSTCYGMNYISHGSLSNKGKDNCTFNLIKTTASAYLLSNMLLSPDRYPTVKDMQNDKLHHMISAIEAIDEHIPEAALMARIQGKPSPLGL